MIYWSEGDSYAAWCLDQAVSVFGNALSDELEGVEGKNQASVRMQRQRIMNQWLTPESGDVVAPGQFSDPAARFKE